MRKHDARKWLHAVLDLLPVILIPVFMVYSHRHTIDSYEVTREKYEEVDFNQLASEFNYKEQSNVTFTPYKNNSLIINSLSISGTSNDYAWDTITNNISTIGHKYYVTYNKEINGIQMRFDGTPYTTGVEFIVQVETSGNFSVDTLNGYTFNDVIVTPQIFDLTQMFGIGNEPTIEQFNQIFPNDYYEYTLSKKELLNVGTETLNNTDIGSQFVYAMYQPIHDYFNFNNVFNFNAIYDWMQLNIFNGTAPLTFFIVWQIVLYEFIMDLVFLIYALFMFFIDFCINLIDRFHVKCSGGK